MRKIILGVAVSLDGYIEGPNGEYDWCFTDQDYGMTEFMSGIDVILYGRKSYEMAGGNIFPDKKAYVFSNTLKQPLSDAEIIQGDATRVIQKMKEESGSDIWLFGGANLTTSLLNANLVDELWLSIHPLLLGSGKLLFQHISERKQFTLKDVKTYSSGLVSLRYVRVV